MKTLRCFFLAFLALVATATVHAQVINGDLDQSGTLDVNDITTLIDNYVTGQPQYINTVVDHYAVDNSLVTGLWYDKATDKYFGLNADGTAECDMGTSFKFLPSQGRILFFNEDSIPVASVNVAYIGKGYLAVLPAGSDVPQIWTERAPSSELNNGREYVDLGLSVKWAKCDVGATESDGFEYGDKFAWGETTAKTTFTEDDYKWYEPNYSSYYDSNIRILKYNCNSELPGPKDNKRTLEESDDAAHVLWGGTWRMPTLAEVEELISKCSFTQTELNGITVMQVTGPNGNSIYMAAGYSYYWTSTLYAPNVVNNTYRNSVNAYAMGLFRGSSVGTDYYLRYSGKYVRPVCK